MKRLAVVTTHPIQYNAPLFKLLNERKKIKLKVFYTWSQSAGGDIYDPGFGIKKAWDIPLLEGYDYLFSNNVSDDPGSHHFKGVINPNLVSEIRSYAPDAILVYGWSFHSHLKVLRTFSNKIPLYFRGDSTLLNETKLPYLKKIARRLFLRWIYRHIDHAFFAGYHNKQYFLAHGMKQTALSLMPHSIDNERFQTEATELPEGIRQQLAIPPSDIIFLYAGKFEPVKNPLFLLKAFISLNQPGIHMVFVGSGILEKEMKRLASGKPTVHFLPFQNQSIIPSVYALADVFVLPSQSETWGLAINEAMAAGKAVLVSDKCGCAPDLVKNGVNGYVFRSEDNVDLLKKMIQLIEHGKSGLKVFGERSKNVIQHWNYNACAEAIEQKLLAE